MYAKFLVKIHSSGHTYYFVKKFLKYHFLAYNWIFPPQYNSHDIL